jgi:myo-inositol-1(or 4)-monophosphatase
MKKSKNYKDNKNNYKHIELKTAIEIAKKAGEYLLKNFRKDKTLLTERGMSKEVTTKYDKESDKIIIKEIEKYFPNHNILTEESGFFDKDSDYTWIVDSLDGSGNFASGNPFFSVSIGIMNKDELVFGVINAPFLEELYYAKKGKGAYLNNKKINVSNLDEIKKSYIVCCEGGSKSNDRLANIYKILYPKVKDFRKIGSAAIECVMVATGRCDGYLTLDISPWDVSAGILLVKEAGGKVTNFKGKEWKPEKMDIVATNNNIHNKLRNVIKEL